MGWHISNRLYGNRRKIISFLSTGPALIAELYNSVISNNGSVLWLPYVLPLFINFGEASGNLILR